MQIKEIVTLLENGGVIAYPTESVYGLGCDPTNEQAIQRILQLKNRPATKGLILIASSWEQVMQFADITLVPEIQLAAIKANWPGPFTWIFPAKKTVSPLLMGTHQSIAIRMTAHPLAKLLCELFDSAIVSTSANKNGEPPAKNEQQVSEIFGDQIDFMVPGRTGGLSNPTIIRDALTGLVIRE